MGDEGRGRRIVVSGTDARKKERMEERNATSLGYRQARPAPARRLVATDRLENGGGAARLMGRAERVCNASTAGTKFPGSPPPSLPIKR